MFPSLTHQFYFFLLTLIKFARRHNSGLLENECVGMKTLSTKCHIITLLVQYKQATEWAFVTPTEQRMPISFRLCHTLLTLETLPLTLKKKCNLHFTYHDLNQRKVCERSAQKCWLCFWCISFLDVT